METDRKTLKQAAKLNMRGTRPSPVLVTLLFLLLTTEISFVISFVVGNPAQTMQQMMTAAATGFDYEQTLQTLTAGRGAQTLVALFLNVLLFLYSAVMTFGYSAYTLRRTKGEETGYGDLLCGFAQVGRVVGMHLIVFFFTIVWTCAVMLPTIFAGIFILTMAMAISEALLIPAVLLFYIIIIGVMVLLSYLTLRYTMAPYFLAENPEMGAMEAVRKSRVLLRNRAGEIFKLSFSFLGWQLLIVLIALVVGGLAGGLLFMGYFTTGNAVLLTVGAYAVVILTNLAVVPLSIWFTPYYCGTMAQYYTALTAKAAEKADPEAHTPISGPF